MSIDVGRAKLNQAMKRLLVRWRQTQASWRDSVGRDFETRQLAPMESDIRSGLGAMERMSEVLQRLRRECE